MAVARGPQVITLSASADAVTERLAIQGLYATGEVTVIVNTADEAIWTTAAAGSVQFPCKLYTDGIKRGAGDGTLYVYLA